PYLDLFLQRPRRRIYPDHLYMRPRKSAARSGQPREPYIPFLQCIAKNVMFPTFKGHPVGVIGTGCTVCPVRPTVDRDGPPRIETVAVTHAKDTHLAVADMAGPIDRVRCILREVRP